MSGSLFASIVPHSNYVVGKRGCGFCDKTKQLIENQSASQSAPQSVTYVDCTPGSATADHFACSAPGISGVPAMVRCTDFGTCSVVGMGARNSMQEIQQVFDNEG